ncbi:MAG: hypothetical protein AB8I58_23065 [Anaerolineales bacterium]
MVVIASSPTFPSWMSLKSMPFMACLTFLSAQDHQDWVDGWRAVRAFFSDYEITIEMECFEIQKGTLFPKYLVQKNDLSFTEKFGKQDIEKFKESYRQAGWRELATSKPLVSRMGSLSILTLWTKESLSGLRLA